MYATASEVEKEKYKHIFNCTQRGHQNTLEQTPGFLILLLTSAVEYPLIASISGAVWLAGRVVYANGYASGDPAKRNRGVFGYLAFLVLLGCSISTVYKLIV